MSEYVTIHGDKWKIKEIKEPVEWAQKQEWHKKKWKARPALISKGKTSEYIGQKYNPKYTKLVEDGWDHDHCIVCYWALCESENLEEGEGYTTDGRIWVCTECFENFIKV